MSEAVNHPKHYNSGKIEVIEFIEDQGFGPGFCRGNAIKYAARAGKKDKTKEIEDLEKAIWYLSREVEMLKAAKEGRDPKRPNDMNQREQAKGGGHKSAFTYHQDIGKYECVGCSHRFTEEEAERHRCGFKAAR